MFKFKESKENKDVDKLVTKVLTITAIPHLERSEDITDLNSFCNRVSDLKNCIKKCKCQNEELSMNLESLAEGLSVHVFDSAGNKILYDTDCERRYDCKSELESATKEIITTAINKKISYNNELIHTCEDELDWLENKMHVIQNHPGWTNYNFNPEKDHV